MFATNTNHIFLTLFVIECGMARSSTINAQVLRARVMAWETFVSKCLSSENKNCNWMSKKKINYTIKNTAIAHVTKPNNVKLKIWTRTNSKEHKQRLKTGNSSSRSGGGGNRHKQVGVCSWLEWRYTLQNVYRRLNRQNERTKETERHHFNILSILLYNFQFIKRLHAIWAVCNSAAALSLSLSRRSAETEPILFSYHVSARTLPRS